jgi:RNA polymerase sigma factor (sigma-70 family)
MDVNANENTATAGRPPSAFGFDRLAQLLGAWQAAELRAARGFPECRGLSEAQLEDLYQDTALALLSRSYASEEHLRNALRHGIRHRALNMHRDQRRRREILAEHAPAMHRQAEAAQRGPEDAALAAQDRMIAKEFLADLDPLERQVFALTAEGLKYRAVATALGVPVNEARSAVRSCERKRARFQLLYETGRLCGYRAATIEALKRSVGSVAAFEQAKAHLAACPACRAASVPGARTRRPSDGGAWVAVLGGATAGWSWVRKVASGGGLTVKATAAVVTAAAVAGSSLGVGGRRAGSHQRPFRPGARAAGVASARAPDVPLAVGAERRAAERPRKGSAVRERRPQARGLPRAEAPARGAKRALVGQPDPLTEANRAEREFGPER